VQNRDDLVIIHYKDDAVAFNGEKKSHIEEKGVLNNRIASGLFELLEKSEIPTHFIKRLNDRDMLCYKANMIPIKFTIRNVSAGSFAKRLGISEGKELDTAVFELSYKNESLGYPFINEYHAAALGISSSDEINEIKKITLKTNRILSHFFLKRGIKLVDLKLEFGRISGNTGETNDSGSTGRLVLADEISPDTCRFWDAITNEKLDKDRFRWNMGSVKEAYIEIMNRISG
jgi:phosphoribosylaminoimidazole-succinocarboxamide synthase